MNTAYIKILDWLKKIEKKTVFIAVAIAMAIAYYSNPLDSVDVTSWNRTFCSALMNGISIGARITNFYKLFFFFIPALILLVLIDISILLKYRESYFDTFFKFCSFLTLGTIAAYISRYTANASEINSNPLIMCLLAFFIVLFFIAVLDKNQELTFKDHVWVFLSYMISIATCSLLFHAKKTIIYVAILGAFIVVCAAFFLLTEIGRKILPVFQNYLYLMMWLPVFIRGALEGIYFLTEKGRAIERYYTLITRAALLVALLILVITWLLRRKTIKLQNIGYIGAIVSFTVVSAFPASYQYTFSYSSFANVYELGNGAVAMDTFLNGKLPIIDYFSAHALADVWTKLIYCFIHGDINGILVNPYGGLNSIIACIVLFCIIRQVFDADIAVLFVLLFPGATIGIKFTSICMIAVALLLLVFRNPSVKTYILFWIGVLISAFTTYDEGISLGVACILAYMIGCLLQKEWKPLRKFIICGASVGIIVLVAYILYALLTGIPVIGRIKEWISVSVVSSSSWATANFGDQTSFAFLVSYFIVPMTAVALLIFTIVRYIKTKKNLLLVIFTTAFSLAEILYITRTIVYHNLAVGSGWTGVLLNFIHWTVAAYVLYMNSEHEKSDNTKLLSFMGTMMAVILLEGTAVTHYWPGASSSLINSGFYATESWNLQNGTTCNQGQPRIVYDEETTELVNSFKNVFDALLTDDQTFLDFANVTSMYLLTGRERPCYVGQSPSLLTDLYSQECFLNEISGYDCPLAVVGTTETPYLQQMVGIPHNVRYYKIAEYIYNNYRPLVTFGEFAIWCDKSSYESYKSSLVSKGLAENEIYTIVDYGYDFTTAYLDENGEMQWSFKPYHSYDLGQTSYIWANYDDYNAINNSEILKLDSGETNTFVFDGSQSCVDANGNYLAFEMTNTSEADISINMVFYDSENEGAKTQYYFIVKPGTNQYLIRVSQDYFWDIFNVDTVAFGSHEALAVDNVRILQGD